MNKLEADFGIYLEAKKRLNEVIDYRFEAVTLKLAHDCRYTPDWFVMESDCTIAFYECKGFRREDAMVKLRVAARMFPFKFYLCERSKGEWSIAPVEC